MLAYVNPYTSQINCREISEFLEISSLQKTASEKAFNDETLHIFSQHQAITVSQSIMCFSL